MYFHNQDVIKYEDIHRDSHGQKVLPCVVHLTETRYYKARQYSLLTKTERDNGTGISENFHSTTDKMSRKRMPPKIHTRSPTFKINHTLDENAGH
jgi:hypothetical protein